MNSQPKVTIVILSWNGQKYLEKFLPSVVATSYQNCEIVVIDNGSSDTTCLFLAENYPKIRQIVHSKNWGFAKGYNVGLKQIESDYFVLLNSDVEVTPDWIQPMVDLLESNNHIAACQPKLLSFNNKEYFEYAGAAGGWLDSFGYPFAKGRIFDVCEKDLGQYNQSEEIFWASGATMFVRSSVFFEMQGFDEFFFAHQEEIDLCWRMQLAGNKIYSCPAAVVYHVGGGTLPRGNSLKTFLNFRNNQIMLYKNLGGLEKCWKIPLRICLDLLSALKGVMMGDMGYSFAIIRAHLAFVGWILLFQTRSIFPKKRVENPACFYNGNLVWQHFVKGKKYFHQLF